MPVRANPQPNRPLYRRGRHCWLPKLRPAVDPRLLALLRPIEPRSELLRASLMLPKPFPLPFRSCPRRGEAAPPPRPCRHCAHAAGPPYVGPHAAVVCITVEAGCVSTTRRLKNPTRASTFVRVLVKGGWVPYMLLAAAALVSPFLQLMAGVVLRRRACSRPRCSSSGKRRKRSGGGGRRRLK